MSKRPRQRGSRRQKVVWGGAAKQGNERAAEMTERLLNRVARRLRRSAKRRSNPVLRQAYREAADRVVGQKPRGRR